MDLYIIRHGQSESNAAKTFCGWAQVNLTEKGRADAANAGRVLEGIKFEKVFSSDLIRAMQTCEIALNGAEYEIDPLLREINVGTLMGLPSANAEEIYGNKIRVARMYRDYSGFGGESTEDQLSRAVKFMRKLEQSDYTGNVAVFCHEGTVRCMLDYILGARFGTPRALVDNGSVSVFSWDGEKWRLKKWNIT